MFGIRKNKTMDASLYLKINNIKKIHLNYFFIFFAKYISGVHDFIIATLTSSEELVK